MAILLLMNFTKPWRFSRQSWVSWSSWDHFFSFLFLFVLSGGRNCTENIICLLFQGNCYNSEHFPNLIDLSINWYSFTMSFEGAAFTTACNWKQHLLVWNHITWCNGIQKILIRKGNDRTNMSYFILHFMVIFSLLPNIVFQGGKKKGYKVTFIHLFPLINWSNTNRPLTNMV